MPIFLLVTILVFHWIADFVCQSDWMAKNKSKSILALFSHTLIYSLVMSLPVLFFPWVKVFFLVTLITHTITDAITSRISSSLYQANDQHNFFVVVGFDQLVHVLTLIATVVYLHELYMIGGLPL